MVQMNKSFRLNPPKYFYVGANGSQGCSYDDEDMETIVDRYEEKRIDLRVFKLDANYEFSAADSPVATTIKYTPKQRRNG